MTGPTASLPATQTPEPRPAADWWRPPIGASWQWQLEDLPANSSLEVDVYDLDLFDTDTSLVTDLHSMGRRVICNIIAGWRTRLASSDVGSEPFDRAYARMLALANGLPESRHVIHSDLLHYNLLVEDDRITGVLDWDAPIMGPASTSADRAAMETTCTDAGGKYLALFDECEHVSSEACTAMGGTFDECASACRHAPEAVMCTAQCVPVCSFGAASAAGQPEAVMAQLSNGSLECNLLAEPKTIDGAAAHYGCQAPGAYLTFVDTRSDPLMAGYFTTDSQSTKFTYGPERVTVVPNS